MVNCTGLGYTAGHQVVVIVVQVVHLSAPTVLGMALSEQDC